MDRSNIVRILKSVQTGTLSVEDASEKLKNLPFEDLNFAHVDHHRHLRQGIPEVIFAKGKKIDEIREIARSMYRTSGRFLITKATEEIYRAIGMRHARYIPVPA